MDINSRRLIAVPALIAALLLLAACGAAEGDPSPDPYGFSSRFEESSEEKYQLKNYTAALEKSLDLEDALIKNGLPVDRIVFDGWGLSTRFTLGHTEGEYIAYDQMILDYTPAKDGGTPDFCDLEAKLFSSSKRDAAVKAMLSVMGISGQEAALIEEMQPGDDIQTMEYLITCYKGSEEIHPNMEGLKFKSYEEYQKRYAQTRTLSCEIFSIKYYPVDNERQTDLYKLLREERKPRAEGRNIDEYGLSFFIPSAFKSNPYNGNMYAWNYYTGEYEGSYPSGISVTMMISGLSGIDVDTYVRSSSWPASSDDMPPFTIREFNGVQWYTCGNGSRYYYAAGVRGSIYEIEVMNGQVIDGTTLEDTLNMIESTLFFE